MATPSSTLPAGWTIRLHTVLNLTILTLLDAGGADREIGFHPLTASGTPDQTVQHLDEITDAGLRDSAAKLIDTHFRRVVQAQANADAFGAAVPDLDALTERLRAVVPGLRADLDVDHDALTVVLTMVASGAAAGQLLSLIAAWPGSTEPDGVRQDLDETGSLTVILDQERAEQFLVWYRVQP